MYREGTKRLDSISIIVDEMLLTISDADRRRNAYIHLYGVSNFASMLAHKRGLHAELAAIAGMLHDYYFYKTGISTFHAENSAEAVRPILRNTGLFSKEELRTILRSIFYHNNQMNQHGVYEETIKDAVMLHHYFHNPKDEPFQSNRLQSLLLDLSIPIGTSVEQIAPTDTPSSVPTINRRQLWADFAEEHASKGIWGMAGDQDYRDLCAHWPDSNIYVVLKDSWCAAFVYYCCRQAGLLLPIRYPNGVCRFAGVAAWLEWAQLPDIRCFHSGMEEDFTPSRGDIVIYEKLLSDDPHDHIGIVLSCDNDVLIVAEGNKDNKNQSAIVHRDRRKYVAGYIRVANEYQYSFTGEYEPILN
ncbi:CHAP domain-containing protein [Paenibacillus sp. RC67]|uniref:CHAP domain-containing protein n=1 Tax=Paenibacillus sp. RC67 TaxID=3039392 RepID=UPI0024AD7E68|nr:CHAP domain-containing protein [Paenibacillus sp. RC67]